MSKLGAALRAKFNSPKDAVIALGLDASLLKEPAMSTNDLAKKIKAVAVRQVSIGALGSYLRPKLAKAHLAMDAKPLGIMSKVFEGVTGANFKAQKPTIAARLRKETVGKLAQDATLDDVEKVLEMLEGHEVEGGDASVSAAEHSGMEAVAHAMPDIPVAKNLSTDAGPEAMRACLKGKGMADDDIEEVMGKWPKSATDEDPEEKKKREAEEKAKADKEAEDKAAKDAEMKDMVSKPAMDAALKATAETVAKAVRDTERGIRVAINEIKPYFGEVPMTLAFDSAADVYRHVLVSKGVEGAKELHPDALRPVMMSLPKIGASAAHRADPALAMDSSGKDDFLKDYPGISNITIGA